jgi:hypothetical protein
MAAVLAAFPAVKQAMDRLSKEGTKLQGTPLATTTTFEMVKSKEMMAQQQTESQSNTSAGGLAGRLARRIQKKDEGDAKPRSLVFTAEHEVQEVSTSVAATDVDLPAGFKEKK